MGLEIIRPGYDAFRVKDVRNGRIGMEKLLHDSGDVAEMLVLFERSFGMSSDDFYASHVADEPLDIPRFERHVWASFYREFLRVDSAEGSLVARAEQSLALA
jgi:hypothetical protein